MRSRNIRDKGRIECRTAEAIAAGPAGSTSGTRGKRDTIEYPLGKSSLAIVIDQLAAWGETRAIPLLERVAERSTDENEPDWIAYPRKMNVEAARAALDSLRKRRGGTGR